MLRFNRFLQPTSASALLLILPLCAQADIQYTTQTSIARQGTFKPISTVTTFAKAGIERTDSVTHIGTYQAEEHSISDAAKSQHLTIDPALKIYVEEPLSSNGETGLAQTSADGMASKPGTAMGTGTMMLTLGTQFLGNVKMLGLSARHYKNSTTIDSTGCCGAGHTAIKNETWMADVKLPVLQAGAPALDWKIAYSRVHPQCKISFERKGDVAQYDEAQKGLALKTITFDASGQPLTSSEITQLSLAPLSASTFEAPGGFIKVTRAEYDQKRQQAMIAAMTAGNTASSAGAGDNN